MLFLDGLVHIEQLFYSILVCSLNLGGDGNSKRCLSITLLLFCLVLYKIKIMENARLTKKRCCSQKYFKKPQYQRYIHIDQVAEWLRRWTANLLGSPRMSSNLI